MNPASPAYPRSLGTLGTPEWKEPLSAQGLVQLFLLQTRKPQPQDF